MNSGYFYASIIAAVILYANTVSVLKKVHQEQETVINTVVGSICLVVIIISIFVICGR